MIVAIDEDKEFIYTLIATTSKGRSNPPKYHDRFKHPILNWRNAGSTEPSWCLCKVLLAISKDALLFYVGKMDEHDYNSLLDFLESI